MNGFNLEEHTEKLEEGKGTTYIKTVLYNVPKAMCERIMGKAKSAHSIELGNIWKIVPNLTLVQKQTVQVTQSNGNIVIHKPKRKKK